VIRRIGVLVAAGLLLSACGSTSATNALRQWSRQSAFTSALATVRGDARRAVGELRAPSSSPSVLHTVCAVLAFDVEQAQASLPTPDSQTTNLLSRAYSRFLIGANQCYQASTPSRSLAVASLEQAGATLAEAAARVRASTGGP
jgi:hypothetical protein